MSKKKEKLENSELKGFTEVVFEDAVKAIPVVPVRDIIMFPGTIVALFLGRLKSINAVNSVLQTTRNLVFSSQIDSDKDDVNQGDLVNVGVLGTILQCIVLPDQTIKVLIDCTVRVSIEAYYFGDIITCDCKSTSDKIINQSKAQVFMRTIIDQYELYSSLNRKLLPDAMKNITAIENPSIVADVAASYMTISNQKKLEIMSTLNLENRMEKILSNLAIEIDILKAEREIQDQIRTQMDKNQREYYLNEQMKAIRKELGDNDDTFDTIEKYKEIVSKKVGLTDIAKNKIDEELKKLKNTSNTSSESGIIKSYLDLMLALPWNEFGKCNDSMKKAVIELENTHYGMDKVKERILEYIAVHINTNKVSGNVICLYGPPGVGKTTLVKSIANAMGRKYVKISLGGLKDSSELFGHRRTYIGALPGRIIQAMKTAKESNPVILLDEIDKMSSDHRGDPSAALLEILDPEQNKNFNDHYLEIDYDISNVVFVATANSLNFSPPLRDRMEILKIPSYLEQEKLEIAKKYLIPKQIELCGIKESQCKIKDEAVKHIIQKYTREAGVRELERCIAKISRKTLVQALKEEDESQKSENPEIKELNEFELSQAESIPEKKSKKKKKQTSKITLSVQVDKSDVKKYLGIEKFEYSETEDKDMIGIVNGLAYTDAGGDVLIIEAVKVQGKGEIKFTGQLGDVMKESIQTAFSHIKANCNEFGIKYEDISKHDIHVHAPDGATPKDGPSAGVTICTGIISLFTKIPVKHKVAMTGEITLRGKVSAIGGLREKLVAALRCGITDVVIPYQNIKDLEEIPDQIKNGLKIHPCKELHEVISVALSQKTTKITEEIKQDEPQKKPTKNTKEKKNVALL